MDNEHEQQEGVSISGDQNPNPVSGEEPITFTVDPEECFAKHAKAIEAIENPKRPTADPRTASFIALGTARRIEPLVPRLMGLAEYDPNWAIDLASYAGATPFAHNVASEADAVPRGMIKEAKQRRKRLLECAKLLVTYELLPAEELEQFARGQSHFEVANFLTEVARLFGEHWTRLENRIPASRADIERAGVLGLELGRELGSRRSKRTPLLGDTPLRTRDKAFALLVHANEQVRRGVSFLRWEEGDVDSIAPTLFLRSKRARKKGAEAAALDPTSKATK